MNDIPQLNTWLGQRMQDMGEAELAGIFKEIADFRRTGILKGDALRNLAREFSDEDEILFEMSRRYYNSLMF